MNVTITNSVRLVNHAYLSLLYYVTIIYIKRSTQVCHYNLYWVLVAFYINQVVSSQDGVEFCGCISFLLMHHNIILVA